MKIRSSLLAPLVALLFLASVWVGNIWELPSMERSFAASSGEVRTADFVVQGLRCRGTSNFFMSMVGEIPGVVSVTTYVQEHRATIKYDPSQTDPESLAEIIGRPVKLPNGRVVSPFTVIDYEHGGS